MPECESTNTLQNMEFSKKLIEQRTSEGKVAFSTTNYHVFRGGMLAGQAGLQAEGMGSKTKWYFWPNAFVREFAGLLQNTEDVPVRDISLDEATGLIDSLSQKLSDINAECDDLKAQRTAVVEDLNRITPFLNLPEDVDKLVHYRFVQVRFGRIAKEYYNKFKEYVYDGMDTWFYP